MKRACWMMLLLAAAAGGAGILPVFSVHWRDATATRRAVAAPPLSLEAYLHEKLPEAPEKKSEMKVDNFACYVCHGNYDGEELVADHGKEEIGCIDCHGKSYSHRNDEDNITPPDKMYPLSAVDKMCAECHDTHDAPARKVLARWQKRCSGKSDPNQIVCTDCHYHHRLDRRTVRWDKKTGELLDRDTEPVRAGP